MATTTDIRRTEILAACRELYEEMNFKDITIKEISNYTSFSRPSIYNYFTTKESIFLEIFREEYIFWCDNMDLILKKNKKLTVTEFASKLALSLENRPVLLKLLSMNIFDLEENCTLEELFEFKKVYKRAINTIHKLLKTYFSQMNEDSIEDFIYTFFPFLFGLYPYTHVTEKQKKAMQKADLDYPKLSIYDFAYPAILSLLKGKLHQYYEES